MREVRPAVAGWPLGVLAVVGGSLLLAWKRVRAMSEPLTDPVGRLADLARHVVAEVEAIYDGLDPLNMRRAKHLKIEAQAIAGPLDGFTEMPDAKHERGAS